MQLRPKVSTRPINHSKSGIVWHQHAQGRAPFRLTAILQVNIRCNSNQGITVDVDSCLLFQNTRGDLLEHHGIDSVGSTMGEPSQVLIYGFLNAVVQLSRGRTDEVDGAVQPCISRLLLGVLQVTRRESKSKVSKRRLVVPGILSTTFCFLQKN